MSESMQSFGSDYTVLSMTDGGSAAWNPATGCGIVLVPEQNAPQTSTKLSEFDGSILYAFHEKLETAIEQQQGLTAKVINLKASLRQSKVKFREIEELSNAYSGQLVSARDELAVVKNSMQILQEQLTAAKEHECALAARISELESEKDILRSQHLSPDRSEKRSNEVSNRPANTDSQQQSEETGGQSQEDFETLSAERFNSGLLRLEVKQLQAELDRMQLMESEVAALKATVGERTEQLRKAELELQDHRKMCDRCSAAAGKPDASQNSSASSMGRPHKLLSSAEDRPSKSTLDYLRTVRGKLEAEISTGVSSSKLSNKQLLKLVDDSIEAQLQLASERDKYCKGYTNVQKYFEDLEVRFGKNEKLLKQLQRQEKKQEALIGDKDRRLAEQQITIERLQQDLERQRLDYERQLQNIVQQRNESEHQLTAFRSLSKTIATIVRNPRDAMQSLSAVEKLSMEKLIGVSFSEKTSAVPSTVKTTQVKHSASAAKLPVSTAASRSNAAVGSSDSVGLSNQSSLNEQSAIVDAHRRFVAPLTPSGKPNK